VVGVCAEFGFALYLRSGCCRGRWCSGGALGGQSKGGEGDGGEVGVARGVGGEGTVVLGVADDAVVVVGVHVGEDAGGGVGWWSAWSAFGVGGSAWVRHDVVMGVIVVHS